jgi:acyl transferase domain-containing protein
MSRDVDEYWRNLCNGTECISLFTTDGEDPDLGIADREHFVPAGGFLEGIDEFDAGFFGFNARDAERMDPQHRIFLECAWHGLERSGYNPDTYPGSIGVWAGAAMSSYLAEFYASDADQGSTDHYGLAIGNDKDHLTTQVAYKLNLRGPSVTIQTACSTSLVSVCLACQALVDHQCDIALAGGVAADVGTGEGYYYLPGSIFSPDGHCRPFDKSASGIVTGNGVGVVVLKRLNEALADGDHIHAVIKGYAVNNDGSRKVGYTAPSIDGQAEVIAMAQEMAGCPPETIGYVEAHGTGTPLGDPIEIAALDKVFQSADIDRRSCAIGSVKGNIGHLDTAAGVASLIKTICTLERGLIPASLHCEQTNPRIDFANSPFYVNTSLCEWNAGEHPRRAGVSSFGIGGTNAHVVLEEPPASSESAGGRPYALLMMSARTPEALDRATDDLADHLQNHPEEDVADVAYTLTVGRKAFEYRRITVVERQDRTGVTELLANRSTPTVVGGSGSSADGPPVVFMFPGQGSQTVDMGLGAYQCEPSFRSTIDLCCEVLCSSLGVDLRRVLYPAECERESAQSELQQTALTQPALFAVEYALAQLWLEWGIAPRAVIGHSLGEYVAACCAGVLSLEDALAVVAERGQLMQRAEPGAMVAVPLSEAALTPYLGDDLSLAAVNGPAACVVSGPVAAIGDLSDELEAGGIVSQRLRTSHAYHSRLMEPVVGPLVDKMRSINLKPPQIPYLSNVSGGWISPETATDPRYWGRQLRGTVRFGDELGELLQSTPDAALLEVGPGRTLTDLARSHPERRSTHVFATSLAGLGRPSHDVASLLHARGTLWLHGVEPVAEKLFIHERRRRVPLPTYPFERERYWLESVDAEPMGADADAGRSPSPADSDASVYRLDWVPAFPPREDSEAPLIPKRWLVFHDGRGLGQRLANRLQESADDVMQVLPGERFEEGQSTFVIRPDDEQDYFRLVRALADRDCLPDAVAHTWSLSPEDEGSEDDLELATTMGFLSLVHLTRAFDRVEQRPIQLHVVADGLYDVVGDEHLVPAKASVLAACRVIPQEHPWMACRLIDVESIGARGTGNSDAVDALAAELNDSGDTNPVVAHRRGRRWLQSLEGVHLSPTPSQHRTRDNGVYLITGGLGRVGLVHAEHLTRTASACLILTGRSPVPEKRDWDRVLAEPGHPNANNVRALRHLEDLGATVSYYAVDAADYETMSSVVEAAQQAYGPVNGIIHAAGVPRLVASISETNSLAAAEHMRGKAAGAAVLARLIRQGTIDPGELDFCMLVSSLSAILGGAGLAAYAAANCYLDALAALENRQGQVPWIGVNWDAWRVGDDSPDSHNRSESDTGIVPARGEQMLARILARAPHQVAVCADDLTSRYEEWVLQPQRQVVLEDSQPQPDQITDEPTQPPRHRRPTLQATYQAARTPSEQALIDIWEDLLGVQPIGVFDSFFELGGHSLLAIQLVSRLQRSLGHTCRLQQIFDAPTVAQLAEALSDDGSESPEEKTQRLLATVENLTEDEVRALLARTARTAPESRAAGKGADLGD